MSRVAVVGASGYVGRGICASLAQVPGYRVVRVTRDNYEEARHAGRYDVLVNAAMPSRRFWAGKNPASDFEETVKKTARLVYGWDYGKFVQVSSISARCQVDTVYGRHKAAAEAVASVPGALIARLGPLYSNDLGKGALFDLLRGGPVYVDGDSPYAFARRDEVADWIATHLECCEGVCEVGPADSVSLRELAAALNLPVRFDGPLDDQSIRGGGNGFPSAREVFAFARNWLAGAESVGAVP